mgnify:CR=1 FL=1
MPEWSKGSDSSSDVATLVSSNLTACKFFLNHLFTRNGSNSFLKGQLEKRPNSPLALISPSKQNYLYVYICICLLQKVQFIFVLLRKLLYNLVYQPNSASIKVYHRPVLFSNARFTFYLKPIRRKFYIVSRSTMILNKILLRQEG